MAKFRNDNLDLETGENIDFDDADSIKMGYDGAELYINSTISGVRAAQPHQMVRYDQLTESSGTLQDQIDYLDTAISGSDEFIELLDTPSFYSGYAGSHVMVNELEDGVEFVPSPPGTIVSGTAPPDSDDLLWYNPADNNIYYYDITRGNWLTVFTHNYLFTYSGNIDGLYMSIGNVVNSYAHFHITRHATVTAITADQDPVGSSQQDKGYEIQADLATIFSFNMVLSEYTNENLNVDINAGEALRMYCSAIGSRARDPIVTLELKWRYAG
jgi:hypothetical protein